MPYAVLSAPVHGWIKGALVRTTLTTRRSIACSIVGVGVHDDPHIFNAGKRLAPKLFTIHHSLFIASYAVRSLCRTQYSMRLGFGFDKTANS